MAAPSDCRPERMFYLAIPYPLSGKYWIDSRTKQRRHRQCLRRTCEPVKRGSSMIQKSTPAHAATLCGSNTALDGAASRYRTTHLRRPSLRCPPHRKIQPTLPTNKCGLGDRWLRAQQCRGTQGSAYMKQGSQVLVEDLDGNVHAVAEGLAGGCVLGLVGR